MLAPAANAGNPPFVSNVTHGPNRTLVQLAANGGCEPKAVRFKLRPSLVQHNERPDKPEHNAAPQLRKRPFVVAAAKSGASITELRTFLPFAATAPTGTGNHHSDGIQANHALTFN